MQFVSTAANRYDVGVYIAKDGGTVQEPSNAVLCAGAAPQVGDGDGPNFFLDLDGSTAGGTDTCGDVKQSIPVLWTVSATVACKADTNGVLTVPSCRVWEQNGNHQDGCTILADAGTGSKCDCSNLTLTGINFAKLKVVKALSPSSNTGKFNLQIDGLTNVSNVGDGGTTGFVDVNTGDHTVGETAGTGTSLSNYDSSITCTNGTATVGPLSGTSLTFNVTNTGGDWVCTITNTLKDLCAGKTCDDGNVCNGTETCDSATGNCQPGTPLVCNDGNVCNGTETCNPTTGCQPGTPLVCNDGNVCNGTETCNPTTGCQPGTPLVCDDGNVCNGTETCNPTTGCQPGTPLVCDDHNDCTSDSCNSTSGCVYTDQCSFRETTQIAPTGTTCQQYVSNTSVDLTTVEYLRGRTGSITSANPGVFFVYDGLHTLNGAISVTQTNGTPERAWSPRLSVQGTQVILYDTSCNVKYNFSSGIPSGVTFNVANGNVVISGVQPGDYIMSVKYDTGGVVGCTSSVCPDIGAGTGTTYSFFVDVDINTHSGSDSVHYSRK